MSYFSFQWQSKVGKCPVQSTEVGNNAQCPFLSTLPYCRVWLKIITTQCAVHCTLWPSGGGIIGKVGVARCTHALVVRCSMLSHSTPVQYMCYAVHMNTCTGQMCPMHYNIFLLYNTLCTGGQMCSMFFTPLQYMSCSLRGHCTAFGQKSIALH